MKTGWESLLKYRAKVFVMEEEYRKDRQGSATGVNGSQTRKNSTTSTSTSNANGNGNGNGNGTEAQTPTNNPSTASATTASTTTPSDSDAASTVAIKSPGPSNDTEDTTSSTNVSYDDEFRKKRLCERWLDNLLCYYMKIYVLIPCGKQNPYISKPNKWNIKRLHWNGKFWEVLHSD